ncbi:serine/threonine protein phosphatase, partial [Desulforhopalus vacuolatus]|nr:serine/threonine protein phosphatase [Desulforhopalus vacuolatus]
LALRGGGPDNVTVVVADVVDHDYGPTQPIIAGAVSGDDGEQANRPNTAATRASAFNPRKSVVKRVLPQADTSIPPRRPRRRIAIGVALAALLALAVLAIGRTVIRSNYYVSDYNGTVSIMRGVQGSIFGFPLHKPYLMA